MARIELNSVIFKLYFQLFQIKSNNNNMWTFAILPSREILIFLMYLSHENRASQ